MGFAFPVEVSLCFSTLIRVDGILIQGFFRSGWNRLYGKLRYVSRLEFLWEHMRRGEVEVPEFVEDHDEELEHRPLMDYGLVESDHHHRALDDPAMDTTASMYSYRCIS